MDGMNRKIEAFGRFMVPGHGVTVIMNGALVYRET
jgi:hypothetical protein